MLGSAEGRTDYRTEVDVVVFVHALISFGLCILCPLSRLYLCRFITILTMIHVYKRRYSSVVEPRDTRSLRLRLLCSPSRIDDMAMGLIPSRDKVDRVASHAHAIKRGPSTLD